MSFSSALRLTDLDDFITPSQACVNPEVIQKSASGQGVKIEISAEGEYSEVSLTGERSVLKPTKISLTDCLACSGCVTSAESVLIEQQSSDEFLLALDGARRKPLTVVSFAPQALTSIAAHFNTTVLTVLEKLTTFFNSLGVQHVFDVTSARDLALLATADEFAERLEAPSATPLLVSACPGWVCYAEKTLGDAIIPYMSRVKSPQQIMGSFVKRFFSKKRGLMADQVYHATVMPCFDKKLEASRADFVDDITRTADVDCVLTSSEVVQLLNDRSVALMELPSAQLDRDAYVGIADDGTRYGRHGSSGGYADFTLRRTVRALTGTEPAHIEFTQLRNSDFKECVVDVGGRELRFATAFGFRNIQNLVRKIKAGKSPYHFVEVMACPAGCLNGGGQVKPHEAEPPREHLKRVETLYTHDVVVRHPEDNPAVKHVISEWFGGSLRSEPALHTVRTQYKAVETLLNPLTIKW